MTRTIPALCTVRRVSGLFGAFRLTPGTHRHRRPTLRAEALSDHIKRDLGLPG